jgi:peptidoglycan/LPS O-acetylase OafA/YrhL
MRAWGLFLTGQQRDVELDALRAIAALGILVFHALTLGPWMLRSTSDPIVAVVNRLDVAVAVFFVLSGFLVYRAFARTAARDRELPSVRRYLARRSLRLLPAYWVALWFAFGLTNVMTFVNSPRYPLLVQIYWEDSVFRGIGAAWSLCTEVTFYVFVPLFAAVVLAVARRHGAGWLTTSLAAIAALTVLSIVLRLAWRDPGAANVRWAILPTNFLWFAGGMVLAEANLHDRSRLAHALRRPGATMYWSVALTAFVVACIVLPRAQSSLSWSETELRFYLYAVVAFAVVTPLALRLPASRLGRIVLSSRVMVLLGLISYGIFLYHMSMMARVGSHVVSTGPYLAAVVATTLVAALLSFVVIEGPLQRFAHRRRSVSR